MGVAGWAALRALRASGRADHREASGWLPALPGAPTVRTFALGCVFLLATAQTARAGTITVEFDLGDSTVSLGGLIDVPPDGSFPRASAIVRVPGNGLSTPVGGPATLVSVVWSVTWDAPVSSYGYQVTFTGNIFLEGLEPAFGTLTPGLGLLTFPNPARVSQGFFLDCFPKVLCNAGGSYFPISTGGTALSPPGTIQVGNLAQNGQATLRLASSVDTYASVMIVGREVDRSFVPEVSSGFSALGAIGAVLGLALWRGSPRRPR